MPPDYRAHILQQIDLNEDKLWEISTFLFDHPEIAFQEHQASKLLSDTLSSLGYQTEIGIGGLPTAFRATLGRNDGPLLAILAEYDALKGLGHACGHNLIASAAIGAAMGLAALNPLPAGQIQIIGTPAEEGGGGKIILSKAGIFDRVDIAMMFHPAGKNMVLRPSLASSRLKVEFFGKASHAAAAPAEGINALDAMVLLFNNINALRQTFGTKDRVAGIILSGGEAVNIVPAYTAAEFSIRSNTSFRRDALVSKVIQCAEAAALVMGCRLEHKITAGYQEIIPNRTLAGVFSGNLISLGREIAIPDPDEKMGSTDMGDVSHLLPSIHPYLAIAPENIAGHTVEFREYCLSETGKAGMLDAAKAMALTAAELLYNPDLIRQSKEEFLQAISNQ